MINLRIVMKVVLSIILTISLVMTMVFVGRGYFLEAFWGIVVSLTVFNISQRLDEE